MERDLIREIHELTSKSFGAKPQSSEATDGTTSADTAASGNEVGREVASAATGVAKEAIRELAADLTTEIEAALGALAAALSPGPAPGPVAPTAAAEAPSAREPRIVGQALKSNSSANASPPSAKASASDPNPARPEHFRAESIPVVTFEHKPRPASSVAGSTLSPILREKAPQK